MCTPAGWPLPSLRSWRGLHRIPSQLRSPPACSLRETLPRQCRCCPRSTRDVSVCRRDRGADTAPCPRGSNATGVAHRAARALGRARAGDRHPARIG
eukprot:7385025-Prymnesium_polylepis.1